MWKFLSLLALAVMASGSKSFSRFQAEYGKRYSSKAELTTRQAIFESNLQKISEHNAKYLKGEVSYEMGVNQFTDLTLDEFQATLTGLPKMTKKAQNSQATESAMQALRAKYANYNFKDSFSWVDEGIVTEPKDQGQCGSCTAFACTGAVESCFAKKNALDATSDDLAEQYLVDCGYGYEVDGFDAQGCDGAWPQAYFGFLANTNDGQHQNEASYPYTARDGNCKAQDSGFFDGAAVTDQISYWGTDEDDLKALLVEHGPVVTGMDASYLSMYHGGVFDSWMCCDGATDGESCLNQNNHAVLVVGYGSEMGEDYWLIKNSWGKYFGESGYFKIKRGTGHCGVGWQLNSVPVC